MKFKALILDADGVLFDGKEVRGILPDGETVIFKSRDYQDGQGLSCLRSLGILINIVSGETVPLSSVISKMNNLPSVKNGLWKPVEFKQGKISTGEKIETIKPWLKKNNLGFQDCVYVGDDLNDYQSMKTISDSGGLSVAPANSTRKIKKIADIVLSKKGGEGAIRELVELVLDARDIDETSLLIS